MNERKCIFFTQHVVKARISLLQAVEIEVLRAARKADGRKKKINPPITIIYNDTTSGSGNP